MLEIKGITHAFNGNRVLYGVNLTIQRGEIVCLLGPSGCGKTTLLRIIAGLERPTEGDILLDGQPITAQPVHKRDFGLMFQGYALFPHMNVEQNVLFGLRMHHTPEAQAKQRVAEVLDLVGLTGFASRSVTELSGGEQQRVALARSLAPHPRLLMLDEPLGSLDAALREQLGFELRRIIKQAQLTSIYVTHDQHEAFAIADRVVIMHAGHIEHAGTPEGLYYNPHTRFTAEFLGLENSVEIHRREADTVHTALGIFPLPVDTLATALLLHPDGFSLSAQHAQAISIAGIISNATFSGSAYQVTLQCQPTAGTTAPISLTFNVASGQIEKPAIGSPMTAYFDPAWLRPLQG